MLPPTLRLTIAALLPALATAALARDLGQDEALRLRQQGDIMALETIIDLASKRYPGATLLEAELEKENDIYQYEIELLTTGGQVRELEIDAHDGRILVDEEDD